MLIPKSTIRFFVFSEDVGEVLSFSVVLCWEARLVPLSGIDGVVKENDVEGFPLPIFSSIASEIASLGALPLLVDDMGEDDDDDADKDTLVAS